MVYIQYMLRGIYSPYYRAIYTSIYPNIYPLFKGYIVGDMRPNRGAIRPP